MSKAKTEQLKEPPKVEKNQDQPKDERKTEGLSLQIALTDVIHAALTNPTSGGKFIYNQVRTVLEGVEVLNEKVKNK